MRHGFAPGSRVILNTTAMIHYSTKDIEALDRIAVEGGLEVRQMMELAGFHMVSVFEQEKISKGGAIAVVCGKGNKGGDGLSAARHLYNHGWKNISIILADADLRPDPAHHLALLTKMNLPVYSYADGGKEAEGIILSAGTVIDALIGYHLEGAPRGAFAELIEVVNKSRARVVSYDLPSGADPTTGLCEGICVKADVTLTLAVPKKLFETAEGKAISGTVYIADLGIPSAFYDEVIPGSRPDFSGESLKIIEATLL